MTQVIAKEAMDVGAIVGIAVGTVVAVMLVLFVVKKRYIDQRRRTQNVGRRGRGRDQEMGTRRLPSSREII